MAQVSPSGRESNSEEETDDLASRFPNADTDERLRTPRGRDLPDPPKVQFTPPTLPQSKFMADDRIGVGGPGGAGLSSDELRGTGLAAGAGIQLVVAMALFTGAGWLLDRYVLHTTGTPWGLIGGFGLGVVSGFMNLFRLTSQLNRDEGGSNGRGT